MGYAAWSAAKDRLEISRGDAGGRTAAVVPGRFPESAHFSTARQWAGDDC